MSAPEAPDAAFDTLIAESKSSLSVIRVDPETGEKTETTLAAFSAAAAPKPVAVEVRKRFTELDGLRGGAALLVVVFHLRHYLDDLNPPEPLYQLVSGGYLMVDLFFVLSGFVLARSMLATRTVGDVLRFSSLRARRFWPLHFTGMAIVFGCVLLTWVAQHYGYEHAPNRAAFSTDKESPWGYLSAALLLQGFIGPHFAGYAAAWSLSIELWTNVLLVAAIAAVPWARRKQLVGPVAMVVGAIILLTLAPERENSMGWTAFGRGLTGLGAGMVVYWVYTAAIRRGLGTAPGNHLLAGEGPRPGPDGRVDGDRESGGYRPARWPAFGAALGLLALLICMYLSADLRSTHFLPVLAIAAALVYCLVQPSDSPVHRLLNSRLLQWLGSRSFALYALHGPTLIAVVLAMRLHGSPVHSPKVALFIVVATLVTSLTAAELGHRFIERLWTPKKTGAGA
jgi:peptidoglycan/LPS O-acetylase OafA/YrhL